MLKRFIYLIMAAILPMPMASCASKYDTGADVSILIATDLHYISPSLTENEELFRGLYRQYDVGDGRRAARGDGQARLTIGKRKPDFFGSASPDFIRLKTQKPSTRLGFYVFGAGNRGVERFSRIVLLKAKFV